MERRNRYFSEAAFEVFPDEKPLTILGEWINGVLLSREMTVTEAKRVFGLESIGKIRKKLLEDISMFR